MICARSVVSQSGKWTEIGQTDWCTAWCVSCPLRLPPLPPFAPLVSASRGAVPTSEVWHSAQREHRKEHPLQLPRHAPVHGQIQPERSGGRHSEPQDRVCLLFHESVTFTCNPLRLCLSTHLACYFPTLCLV